MTTSPYVTETALLQALRNGERAAFAQLVESHSPAVYRLALQMLKDPTEAEDVLQETFIKAFRYLPSFDGRSSLATWLYRIATNEALMLLRKRKFDTISIEQPDPEEGDLQEPLQIEDWTNLPEDELLSAETRQYVQQAIQSLPETLRIVFTLRELQGLSTLETAQILNLTEAAVKTRLSRARLQLREQLTEYFHERKEILAHDTSA